MLHGSMRLRVIAFVSVGTFRALAQSAARTFAFSVDLLQGATGYFNVEGYDGVQPELTMVR